MSQQSEDFEAGIREVSKLAWQAPPLMLLVGLVIIVLIRVAEFLL